MTLSSAALNIKLDNLNANLDRVSLQLQDESISDMDYDLLKSRAIKLDSEKTALRQQLAILSNEQQVNDKL